MTMTKPLCQTTSTRFPSSSSFLSSCPKILLFHTSIMYGMAFGLAIQGLIFIIHYHHHHPYWLLVQTWLLSNQNNNHTFLSCCQVDTVVYVLGMLLAIGMVWLKQYYYNNYRPSIPLLLPLLSETKDQQQQPQQSQTYGGNNNSGYWNLMFVTSVNIPFTIQCTWQKVTSVVLLAHTADNTDHPPAFAWWLLWSMVLFLQVACFVLIYWIMCKEQYEKSNRVEHNKDETIIAISNPQGNNDNNDNKDSNQ